jgi:hypothetical protein
MELPGASQENVKNETLVKMLAVFFIELMVFPSTNGNVVMAKIKFCLSFPLRT